MSVPSYEALMLPVLSRCAERVWTMIELVGQIADDVHLSVEQREESIPSGVTVIANRVGWAKTYLKQAGLVSQPKRAMVEITARGRALLETKPLRIDGAVLRQFEEFRAFQKRTKPNLADSKTEATLPMLHGISVETASTPEEQIGTASRILDESLRDALLGRLREGSPAFFEKTIIDLLIAMGYGGSKAEAGEQLGGSGDGGVDGVIREDQLGLDRIYLQAKRYQQSNTIASEAVRGFVGALIGQGAQKGVFITTSSFSPAALEAARQSGNVRLVLIDGNELTKLMLRFNVGVRVAQTVEIKRIDLEYFGDVETE